MMHEIRCAILQTGLLQSSPDLARVRCGGLTLLERQVLGLHHQGIHEIQVYDPTGSLRLTPRLSELPGTTVQLTTKLPEFSGCILWVRVDAVMHKGMLTLVRKAEKSVVLTGLPEAGRSWTAHSEGFLEVGKESWTGVVAIPAFRREELERYLANDSENGDIQWVHERVQKDPPIAKNAGNLFFHRVRDKTDVSLAERLLFHSLKKPQDGLVARTFNRPMSLPVSRLLAKTSLTPNQLTVINAGFAVLSAFVLLFGHGLLGLSLYMAGALGGILIQMCSIYDGCDGEIARVKFQYSHLGDWLDTIFDDICNCLFFAGVAGWSYFSTGQTRFIYMGMAAFVGQWIANFVMYYYLIKVAGTGNNQDYQVGFSSQPGGGLSGRIFSRLKMLTKRDFHLFAFMLLGLSGVLHIGAYIIFAMAVSVAVILLIQHVQLVARLRREKK